MFTATGLSLSYQSQQSGIKQKDPTPNNRFWYGSLKQSAFLHSRGILNDRVFTWAVMLSNEHPHRITGVHVPGGIWKHKLAVCSQVLTCAQANPLCSHCCARILRILCQSKQNLASEPARDPMASWASCPECQPREQRGKGQALLRVQRVCAARRALRGSRAFCPVAYDHQEGEEKPRRLPNTKKKRLPAL